jgi:hypothetical protein
MSDVQLNVLSQSSFLDFSITRRFVTGAGPMEKNPTRAESSMRIGMLETKYIDPHVIVMATEQMTIIVLRQCIVSVSLPQKTAPSVMAKFERKRAMATSLTWPPSASTYIGIIVDSPVELAFIGRRYHDHLRLVDAGGEETCNY